MSNDNGHFSLTQAADALLDEEENAVTLAQERDTDEAATPVFPCPDVVWQGGFLQVAEALGHRSWEVFMGAACGLGALAAKSIDVRYYGRLKCPLYGLLIKPTGTGKSICTDTFQGLLPEWYSTSGAVQSGPGLLTIVAKVERDKNGNVGKVHTLPAALIIEEWTRLAKNLKLQFSTLMEDMNQIWDGKRWNISRSDANKTGGGNVVVHDPLLTVCATTTESLFTEEVTPRMVRSGFLNRYLTLPGSMKRWKLIELDAAAIDYDVLMAVRDRYLQHPHRLGDGRPLWDLYTPEALECYRAWGEPLLEPIMDSKGPEADLYKRLHTNAQKLALIYAWSSYSPHIELSHIQAVISILDVSRRYVASLMEETEITAPAHVRYEIEAKDRVCQKIQKESGKVDLRKLGTDLRKSMRSSDIRKCVQELLSEGQVKKVDGRWLKWVEK